MSVYAYAAAAKKTRSRLKANTADEAIAVGFAKPPKIRCGDGLLEETSVYDTMSMRLLLMLLSSPGDAVSSDNLRVCGCTEVGCRVGRQVAIEAGDTAGDIVGLREGGKVGGPLGNAVSLITRRVGRGDGFIVGERLGVTEG